MPGRSIAPILPEPPDVDPGVVGGGMIAPRLARCFWHCKPNRSTATQGMVHMARIRYYNHANPNSKRNAPEKILEDRKMQHILPDLAHSPRAILNNIVGSAWGRSPQGRTDPVVRVNDHKRAHRICARPHKRC